MKWLFYVIVFVYMFYRTVYGLKPVENSLSVDFPIGEDNFVKVGGHKTVNCKGSNKNQKLEWIDPKGHTVKRVPGSRVFAQEHFSYSKRARALALTINNAAVSDTGVYQCKSGELVKNVSLCIFEPSDFGTTLAEINVDLGRSITLSCEAKGDPEPRIEWRRNGETINDEESSAKYKSMTKYNIQGFEGQLTIISLQPEDSGIYSCVSIQESILSEDCTLEKTFNITLNVNYAPIFEDGNDTKLVYGINNQEVELECSAYGYPAPTYRWFLDKGDDVLFEFNEKQIQVSEDSTQAVLTVIANETTIGHAFKCQATNEHGDSSKYFSLLKAGKPRSPSKITLDSATDEFMSLNVTWPDGIDFPIRTFAIQHVKEPKKLPRPKDLVWKKSILSELKLEEVNAEEVETGSILVPLDGLDEDSKYLVRVRVQNEAGESAWSDSVSFSTKTKEEVVDEQTESPDSTDSTAAEVVSDTEDSDTTFYGIFFAGGIFVVAFVCMFAMRIVK